MIRRPPRSTPLYSSAASDVYKRQDITIASPYSDLLIEINLGEIDILLIPVSYTHLRAHETKANLVCRLLLEKYKYQMYVNFA